MQPVTAYQCDHCGKVVKHKSSAAKHEKACKRNLDVRACTTCRHHEIVTTEHYGSWNEPPFTDVEPVCNSPVAVEDEDFCFSPNGNPFYIVRHCAHHQPKDTATPQVGG